MVAGPPRQIAFWITAFAVALVPAIAAFAGCKNREAAAIGAGSQQTPSQQAPPVPPPPAELLPFADAPAGTRVGFDRDSLSTPKVVLRGTSERICTIEGGDRSVRCAAATVGDAGSPDARLAKLPRGPVYRLSALPDGSALALIGKPEKNLEPQPGARFAALSTSGQVLELPVPELDKSEERAMTLAGDWLLWLEPGGADARVHGRRWNAAHQKLGESLAITTAPSSMSFLDGCLRRAGRAVLLAAPGKQRYQARDPFVVLFQNGDGWQAVGGEAAHLYPDPAPAFARAELTCDDAGIWLTWTARVRGLHFARCTPGACRHGSFAVRGSAANARAVELAGRIFLLTTTHSPAWGIAVRSGKLGQLSGAPEARVIDGGYLEDVLARGETAFILARSEKPPRAAAFRLDASGRVEAIRPAP
jgi:hypothetical protein